MVKLASAREKRMYGPRVGRERAEYMNAGGYVLGTILLTGGFAAQLWGGEPKSGVVLVLMGFGIIMIVNLHDLIAHLAGIDYRLPALMDLDLQLALVEFAVPLLYIIGAILFFFATLFIFIQAEKGYENLKLEGIGVGMLIGGAGVWVVGSIHNSCQIYERADGHVQILQQTVLLPFLMASLLFLVGAISNARDHDHDHDHLMGERMIWLGVFGSLILFMGGLANVVKVFKMQQRNGMRLEKLRGGAQERLHQIREPLLQQQQDTNTRQMMMKDHPHQLQLQLQVEQHHLKQPTPYKDALVAQLN